jgi:cytochrome c biogenesis protein
MRVLKRAWYFWGRTRVAVWLLALFALLMAVGTFFPQLPADAATHPAWLTAAEDKYGPLARAMAGIQLFAFYRSPWFGMPASLLAVCLLICTLIRLRPVWRSGVGARRIPALEELSRYPFRSQLPSPEDGGLSAVGTILRAARLRVIEVSAGGRTCLLGERNRVARLGTLATHIAPLLLLIGIILSGLTGWRQSVALTDTGARPVTVGPTGAFQVELTARDGYVERHADGSLADYGAGITIFEGGQPVREGLVRVNHPMRYRGVSLILMEYDDAGEMGVAELLAVRDSGRPVVVVAGVLLVIGVCLTFYFPHQQVWAWLSADGVTELAGRTAGDVVRFEQLFDKVIERGRVATGESSGRGG